MLPTLKCKSYKTWRRMFLKALYLLFIFMILSELVVFLLLRISNDSFALTKPGDYFIRYILTPVGITLCIIVIASLFEYYIPVSERVKNYILLIAYSANCFTVAYIHSAFPVTSALFVVPVIICILFSDSKILRATTAMNFLGLLFVWIQVIHKSSSRLNPLNPFNMLVMAVILAGIYQTARILIRYGEHTLTQLATNTAKQEAFIEQLKRDSLTGLYNQKTFYVTLDESLEGTEELMKPHSLGLLDIDDFHLVNDCYGHQFGDQVLINLAAMLRSLETDQIHVCRYGGTEFAIIFENTDSAQAKAKLDLLRIQFQSVIYEQPDIHITFSAGIAQFNTTWTSQDYFNAADAALFKAKATTKNKTIVYCL